jgi:hypothetical protein
MDAPYPSHLEAITEALLSGLVADRDATASQIASTAERLVHAAEAIAAAAHAREGIPTFPEVGMLGEYVVILCALYQERADKVVRAERTAALLQRAFDARPLDASERKG